MYAPKIQAICKVKTDRTKKRKDSFLETSTVLSQQLKNNQTENQQGYRTQQHRQSTESDTLPRTTTK